MIKMIKIDIFSGFLGAGKTTLIKKLIAEAYKGEKLVLIENEFGDIGIDGEFLKDSGVQINELNSGCICCSLVGDFSKALVEVCEKFSPDRIIIEPSGVGKLSDVINAVRNANDERFLVNGLTTVADASKCKMYIKNFGEFFNNQIENAGCIVLSHTVRLSEEKLSEALKLIKEHNDDAVVITTDWDKISGEEILAAIENKNSIDSELEEMKHEHHHHHHDEECGCHGHHHHHHDEECGCHKHHHDDEECDCHEHHHHDEDCDCHEHHHHHDGECHCHEHGHEHHHHADDVFTSCGFETVKSYSKDEIQKILSNLENEEEFGNVLRAKGVVKGENDEWIHFDYVPGEPDVRGGGASVCGRICVIGANINEEKIKQLFNI